MAFICIPILFGCTNKISPEGDQTPRICPRCHNVSVVSAKSRMWFELFFIPLVPMQKKHLWMCSVCQWHVPTQPGWEPQLPASGYNHGSFQPGYQPQYYSPQQSPPPPR
ncbi:hypothetical protein FA95DRAFT_1591693 [Auriscalpium vulgare]|uniref:Uncharacterized protein n=1 Tax=Auriscalpium vulgare TaxID=40419 RepID=A0ACB8SC95_9AGAM|nr:hypothetical protein FA95DRAFT_1591693 [Auriscalpium vulgare]